MAQNRYRAPNATRLIIAAPTSDVEEGFLTDDVLFEEKDGVAKITLNRPAQRNALSADGRRQFDACLTRVSNSARVVLLCAAGDNFCAGADLANTPSDPMEWRDRILTAQSQHARLINMKQVVVSAVQGMAVGGGASLALAADIMIMSENAVLSFPFVKLGVVPDGGASFLLQAKVGSAIARDILISGGTLTASEAAARGLTRRVVPNGNLIAAARDLAKELSKLPSEAVQLTKSLCAQTWAPQLMAAFRHEADAFALATVSNSHREAIAGVRARLAGKEK